MSAWIEDNEVARKLRYIEKWHLLPTLVSPFSGRIHGEIHRLVKHYL